MLAEMLDDDFDTSNALAGRSDATLVTRAQNAASYCTLIHMRDTYYFRDGPIETRENAQLLSYDYHAITFVPPDFA